MFKVVTHIYKSPSARREIPKTTHSTFLGTLAFVPTSHSNRLNMEMKISYDTLAAVSRHLPYKSRLELSLTDKTTHAVSYASLLRENVADFVAAGPGDWMVPQPHYALCHAIARHKNALLGRILDLVELVPGLGSRSDLSDRFTSPDRTWVDFYLGEVSDCCFRSNNHVALEMMRSRFPGMSEHLSRNGQRWVYSPVEGHSDAAFLDVLSRAGWSITDPELMQGLVTMTNVGQVMRGLIKLGADPTEEYHFLEDTTTSLHWRSHNGRNDKELLGIIVEHGVDIEGLTDLPVSLERSGDLTPPTEELVMYTALDLAARAKNFRTMESLLSLGANPDGSLAAQRRLGEAPDTGSPWITTTPLHELFYRRMYYSGSRFTGLEWCHNRRPICLGESEEPRPGTICPTAIWESHPRSNLLQDLEAFVRIILRGARLLLDHGCDVDADIAAQAGAPLSRFLALAADIRARYLFLTADPDVTDDCPSHHDDCPVARYSVSEARLLCMLAETCDLLVDAGARIHVPGYTEGEVGVPRLLQLLRLQGTEQEE